MKRKEVVELHHKEPVELMKMLTEARTALFGMKMDAAQFKLKNTSSLNVKRREIAVILSVLRGKEIQNGKNA